jgi:hypothetical protein
MATPTTSVPGIGKATAFALAQHGITSAEELAASDEEALYAVSGFGPSKAATAIRSAQKLIAAANPGAAKTSAGKPKAVAPAAKKGKDGSSSKKKKSRKKAEDEKPEKGKRKAGKGKKKSKKKKK